MFNILAANKIAKCGIDELPVKQFSVYNIPDQQGDEKPQGILIRSYVLPEEDLNKELLAISRAGAGTNNIPIQACTNKGIVVFNTPGANANAVKELVLCSLLMASRNIVGGIEWSKNLKGQENVAKTVEKNKHRFVGPEISGKTLGVVGLGAIGVLVANAARSLGMNVYGYDPFISVDAAWGMSPGVRKSEDLNSMLELCDYISIHVPLNQNTQGMFNDELFANCKRGIKLINLSRAELVDNNCVKKAIADGIVHLYVTDFPTEDILDDDKIIPIPHLGASTPESEDNCATMAAIQLRDYLLYGNIKNSVNFPDCSLPYSGQKRICIIHKNVANVIGNITGLLAEKNINIDNMLNKSKGDHAYTMIDIDRDRSNLNKIEIDLEKIENIMKVRVI